MSQLFPCGCCIEDHYDGPDIVYCNYHSGADKPHRPTFIEKAQSSLLRGALTEVRDACKKLANNIDHFLKRANE